MKKMFCVLYFFNTANVYFVKNNLVFLVEYFFLLSSKHPILQLFDVAIMLLFTSVLIHNIDGNLFL